MRLEGLDHESASACGLSDPFEEEAEVVLWHWLTPWVEPGLPGLRLERACDGGLPMACNQLRQTRP